MKSTILSIFACLATSSTSVYGFHIPTPSKLTSRLYSSLFESDSWKSIQQTLNSIPVFCCANEKGEPLEYEMNELKLPFFYCSVDMAKDELDKINKPELAILPFPLGDIYRQSMTGSCVLVPSQKAIEDAGAPAGASPLGQVVPLFCCMEIGMMGEDGKAVLPLFLEQSEAKKAMDQAVEAGVAGEGGGNLEVMSLSLNRAIELLATTDTGAPGFMFVPPESSVEHIQKYLGGIE